MIKETFGLTTVNFIKFIVLVIMLFFFIRTVNMIIGLITNKKSKEDLKKLFIATEILIWSTLTLWIFYLVPRGKLEFLGFFVILNLLNLWLWIKIKQGVAGLFFRLAYSPKQNDFFKVGGKNVQFLKSDFDAFEVSFNVDSTEKYFYLDALKKGIQKPIIDLVKKEQRNNDEFDDAEQLFSVLKNNGFVNEDTRIKIFLDGNMFEIKILSYSKAQIEEIKQFLDEIF